MNAVALRTKTVPRARTQGLSRKKRASRITVNMVPWILIILSLTLICLLHVQARTSIIRERYLLERARTERKKLDVENRKLRVTRATLGSNEQVEIMARKRGLVFPGPQEVFKIP